MPCLHRDDDREPVSGAEDKATSCSAGGGGAGCPFVIAANLLQSYGTLTRVGIPTCAACQADPAYRAYLGCGQRPEGWDADALIAEAEADGWPDSQVLARAGERWRFGHLGFIWDGWQRLWPWCPRWFVEHAAPEAVTSYNHIMAILRRARRGLPQEVELTAAGEDLVLATADYWDILEKDRIDREWAEQHKESK